MNANTLRRHFKEGIKNVNRNGWMTFASVSAVTVTLLIVGVFLLVFMNFNHMASKIESNVQVNVYISKNTTPEQREVLNKQISKISQVREVEYETKDQQLDKLIKDMGDDSGTFESLRKENPLNDAFIVKAKNPQDTKVVARQIEKLGHIDKVDYGAKTVEKLFKVLTTLRNFGTILVIGLVLTAMFLISNTIKITILARKNEIEIMKLVGATNSFIRWPFFVEGLTLGLIGSVVPVLVVIIGYASIFNKINPGIQTMMLSLVPVFPSTIQVSLVLIFIGALIGVWGSVVSLRRFLKI